MKIENITKSLILVSAVAVAFNIVRLDLWGTTNLLYLTWNLFLAWIPYIISLHFIKKDMPVSRFIPIFILWLLFFPNAPYLATDVVHIVLSSPSLLWYDGLLFFFFGWIGLLLGMLSLFHIHRYFKAHLTYPVSEFFVFAICLISSFGIYLGRFERLNSWDLLINPLQLAKHSFNVLANLAHTEIPLIMFVGIFTIFMYLVYKIIYVLLVYKVEP